MRGGEAELQRLMGGRAGTRALSLSHTHTRTHAHTHTLSLSLSFPFSLSLCLSFSLSHIHTLSLSHTHTLSLSNTLTQRQVDMPDPMEMHTEYLEYARDNNLIDSSVVFEPFRVSYD